MRHPIQPLAKDDQGVLRFKKNAIVEFLLDNGGFDMNAIAVRNFSNEDREQFAQLIGYSLGGFSELSYVSDETYEAAQVMSEGELEQEARIKTLTETLRTLREGLREPVAKLFGIHPDDLKGE